MAYLPLSDTIVAASDYFFFVIYWLYSPRQSISFRRNNSWVVGGRRKIALRPPSSIVTAVVVLLDCDFRVSCSFPNFVFLFVVKHVCIADERSMILLSLRGVGNSVAICISACLATL